MSGIQSLVPTDPVPSYPICGKDVLSTEVVAISLIPAPAKEEYMIFTDSEFAEVLRSLDFLDTERPTCTSAHILNEYIAPIPNLLDVVQVECETALKNVNSQDWVRSGTMEPVSPSSSIVPKRSSHEDIVLVAGKATRKHNLVSKRNTKTRAKSSSGRRTGGREEGLPSQQSRRDGGHERADGPSGKKFMGRGVRIDLMLERGQKPPTKRRRDDDTDGEESSSTPQLPTKRRRVDGIDGGGSSSKATK